MKQEQFKALEDICKKAWGELAVSGDDKKPDYLSRFAYKCTACDIARRTMYVVEAIGRCYLCPVDEWREVATKSWSIDTPCDVGIYGEWLDGYESTRKEAAAQIAAMKWSYLPEYEDIDVSDLLEG